MDDKKRIIVALDYDNIDDALSLIDSIDPSLCRVKIGKELFSKYGPLIVGNVKNKGFEIFLDLKFHDIPTTIYKACVSAFSLDIWMLNIHLSGGLNMALSAMKAKEDVRSSTQLIGVTALTSLSDKDCLSIYGVSRSEQVRRFKQIGQHADIDGYVCSANDIISLKGRNKIYVTPGIRLTNNKHDHHQSVSPREAIKLGSNYLVIGRSITESENPNHTLKDIIASL